MALFRSNDDKLLVSLTKGVRLTLPADPGFDRLLDACQQYSPEARPSKMNREWICADGNHYRLHRPNEISPELAARAGLPSDITCAYFTDWDGAGLGQNQKARRAIDLDYIQKSKYLLGGLAARFGGLWYPQPDEMTRPLRAYVFTERDVDAAGLLGMASRYAPGLGLGDPRPDNVITLRGSGAPARVQYYPPAVSAVPKSALVAGPGDVPVLGPSWVDDGSAVILVEAEQPAAGADPGVARAVGAVGAGLAAETGGVCVDVFGYRVRDAADLIVRAG
jgi:hypothetical protein